MKMVRQMETIGTPEVLRALSSNDNRRAIPEWGRSLFPDDAVARIFQPSRSVMTSGRARAKGWRLAFERRSAPFIEPLMGYTGGEDTLAEVELSFPDLDSAIRYAKRQGLAYRVEPSDGLRPAADRSRRRRAASERTGVTPGFSDATLDRLELSGLKPSYERALDRTANRNEGPLSPDHWRNPMDVVHDAELTLEAKRSILMNWAWSEHLIDQATNEGMPEHDRPSRLDEVDQALLALEHAPAEDRGAVREPAAA